MEVPVADDAPALIHRPMVGEPDDGLLQTAEAPASDPAFQAGEVALEGDQLTADRRPAGRARRLAFTVERQGQDLGVERVKPELHLDQHRPDPEPPRTERRPAPPARPSRECAPPKSPVP